MLNLGCANTAVLLAMYGKVSYHCSCMRMSGIDNGNTCCGTTYSAAAHGFIYIYMHDKAWRATSGRRTPRRAAGGRTPRRAADRRALHYGWAYVLALWGKGGHGGRTRREPQRGGREDVLTLSTKCFILCESPSGTLGTHHKERTQKSIGGSKLS
jgi:hypothetical protein